jgi:GGDEF domain-containing protein
MSQSLCRLRDLLLDSDTPGRMRGDEFLVLLPEINSESDAVTVAEKIVTAFQFHSSLKAGV